MADCRLYTTTGELLMNVSLHAGMVIGRSSSCDVCLKGICGDTVSREQFTVEKRKDGLYLKNIGNAKLYSNGTRIEESPLIDGLVLRFSSYVLAVGSKTGPSPFELTWAINTENNQRRAVLWYGVNTLGSSMDNYVVIKNNDIERQHAKVTVNKADQVFLECIGMGRSICVNHVDLEKGMIEIKEEDEILLGEETFVNLIRGIRNKNVLSKAEISGANVEGGGGKVAKMAKTPLGVIIAILLVVLLFLLLFILFAQSVYEMLFA